MQFAETMPPPARHTGQFDWTYDDEHILATAARSEGTCVCFTRGGGTTLGSSAASPPPSRQAPAPVHST